VHSNKYTLIYALGVTTIVAVTLAVAAGGLRVRQEQNVSRAKRAAILGSVMEVDPTTLDEDYDAYITEYVFDADAMEIETTSAFEIDVVEESRKSADERFYPLYVASRDGATRYIVPIEGSGLWGPIRAFVALESDLDTIHGIVFEHEKETPGLGAEISTPEFQDRFRGKRLYDDDGVYQSIRAVKGAGSAGQPHQVDGLTGATMTMNGLNDMLARELALYEGIFSRLR